MSDLDRALAAADDGLDKSLERLFGLLKIPSISTDPAYRNGCREAADWLKRDLAALGFAAELRETPGHPIVLAKQPKPGGLNVLFYGHYDVQPVDPLDKWETPPFEPKIAEVAGRKIILGRGASDDKGQVMTFIEACRAWKAATGDLPVGVTLLIEGEEESGSVNLPPFIEDAKAELRADVALVCDTTMWAEGKPAITSSLRGLIYEEVTVKAANRDLHSGMYGGAARNPLHVLSAIVAALHDGDGRVALPGFYDGVGETPEDVREQWRGLGLDADAFLGPIGLSQPAGEDGHSRRSARQDLLPARRRPGPRRDPPGLPRLRPRAHAGRLLRRLHRPQGLARDPAALRQPGPGQDPRGARSGMGRRAGDHRLRRLDPGGRRLQARAGARHAARRLRSRRRSDPLAQREIRPGELPEGRSVLDPHPRRARGLGAATR
jgi:hypothetical protein